MPSLAITWAQRLKRVFNIDIETCEKCQGPVWIIAIEDPADSGTFASAGVSRFSGAAATGAGTAADGFV